MRAVKKSTPVFDYAYFQGADRIDALIEWLRKQADRRVPYLRVDTNKSLTICFSNSEETISVKDSFIIVRNPEAKSGYELFSDLHAFRYEYTSVE